MCNLNFFSLYLDPQLNFSHQLHPVTPYVRGQEVKRALQLRQCTVDILASDMSHDGVKG